MIRLRVEIYLLAAYVFALTGSVMAEVRDVKELEKRILAVAEPLTEDRVFYRWQSKKSGETLLREGKITDQLFEHFKKTSEGDAAGSGLYIAGNPLSSAEYVGGEDGTLIEVHLKKGMRFIDRTNQSDVRRLRAAGISLEDLENNTHAPVLVKYDKTPDWWVVKAQEGVSFHEFTGANLSIQQLDYYFHELKKKDLDAFRVYVKSIRKNLVARLEKDASLARFAVVRTVLPKAQIASEVERGLAIVGHESEGFDEAVEHLTARPDVYEALSQSSKKLLVDSLITTESTGYAGRILRALQEDPLSAHSYNGLVYDLLISPKSPTYIKTDVARSIIAGKGKALAKMEEGKLTEVLQVLAEVGSTGGEKIYPHYFMEAFALASLQDQKKSEAHRLTLSRWLNHSDPNIQERAIGVYTNLPREMRDLVLDQQATARVQQLLRSKNNKVAQRAFIELLDWEHDSMMPGHYMSRDLLSGLLRDRDSAISERTLEWIQEQVSPYKVETFKHCLDNEAVAEAGRRSAHATKQWIITALAYPDQVKLPPNVDLPAFWNELNFSEKSSIEMLIEQAISEKKLSPEIFRGLGNCVSPFSHHLGQMSLRPHIGGGK